MKTKEIRAVPFGDALGRWCRGELVGMGERIQKLYNYERGDGLVEVLLRPKFRQPTPPRLRRAKQKLSVASGNGEGGEDGSTKHQLVQD